MQLLVNQKVNPVGISENNINFSFIYEKTDNMENQQSYRILISDSNELHNSDVDYLWDSGEILSSKNLYIPYLGRELPQMQPLYIKAAVTLENAEKLTSSAVFVVANSSWNGQWIWKKEATVLNDYVYFKKKFALTKAIDYCFLSVSAHNYYKLNVNGNSVGGYVIPSTSNPYNNKLFLTYDITHLLKEGENKFDFIVHYLGGSGQNYINGNPGLICQCSGRYVDKTAFGFGSDESFYYTDKTNFEQQMPYQQNRRMSAIERFDARVSDCESVYKNAVIVSETCEMPILVPQQINEGEIEREITPTVVNQSNTDVVVFDTGLIISGFVKLTLNAPKGTKIQVRYSEDLDENNRVKHNVCNESSENYYDEYITGSDETEIWSPSFSYKAFRYFEVVGEVLALQNAKVLSAHTALDCIGEFECDNELLNKIYKACIQTQKNNVLGIMVDCPHREQAQYLADSDNQAETLLYYFNNPQVLEKVLSDFQSGQLEDGTFNFVYPVDCDEKGFKLKIPEWDLHYCSILWKLYFATGDISYIKKYYKTAQKTINFYLGEASSCKVTGLVKKSKNWHISDWPYPKIDESGEILTVENIKVYKRVILLSKMAELIGLYEESKSYQDIAKTLRASIRLHLYSKQKGLFMDCINSESFSKGTNAVALYCGIFDANEIDNAVAYLAAGELETSTLLTLDLLKVLFENGKPQTAYEILAKKDFPSWGYMMELGYQTIWEGFSDIESHCHAWNAYPARIFAEYLVGIRCAEAGFKKVDIKPYFPIDLSRLSATVTTPQGTIICSWQLDESNIVLSLSVPHGILANIYLPDNNGGHILKTSIGKGVHSIVFDR